MCVILKKMLKILMFKAINITLNNNKNNTRSMPFIELDKGYKIFYLKKS
jgi:hypothetical protein